ncbi:hypothetical protein Tco_0596127 [Tanacetum coccineum]
MAQENYVEGCSMQRPPLLEAEGAKVMAIEEAKDLATLPLDELIGNLKVYEMILENDGIASKTTKEKVKCLDFKAKVIREQTSDDNLGVTIDSATGLIDLEEVAKIVLGTKEVKAQDKREVATTAAKKITSLVNVQSPRRTRILLEELRAIAKTATNRKRMQHVCLKFDLTIGAYDGGKMVVFGSNLKGKVTLGELPDPKSSPSVEDDRISEPIVQDLNGSLSLQINVSDEGYPKSVKKAGGHPIEQVIGELNERTLRSKIKQA